MTPANLEYFLVLKPNLIDGIQKHIQRGDFSSINVSVNKENNKLHNRKKKNRTKPRAFSGNDEMQQQISFPLIKPQEKRQRADTDTFQVRPLDYIPPPKSKLQPWGCLDLQKVNLESLQQHEKQSTEKLNKWGKPDIKNSDFTTIQIEEKQDQELEEVLIMIAKMESMSPS